MVNLKLAKQRQQDPEIESDEQKTEAEQRAREKRTQAACDFFGLVGLGSLGFGLYQVHPPSMFIICGALVLVGALFASRA